MGTKRFRVAMLTGCAQDPIFSNMNRDTVEVLARNRMWKSLRRQNKRAAVRSTRTMANGNSRRNSRAGTSISFRRNNLMPSSRMQVVAVPHFKTFQQITGG